VHTKDEPIFSLGFNQYHLPPSLLFSVSCLASRSVTPSGNNCQHQPPDFLRSQLLICMHKFHSAGVSFVIHTSLPAFESYLIHRARFSLSTARLLDFPPFSFFSHPLRAPLISGSIPLEINISTCIYIRNARSLALASRRFVNHTPKATNLQESTKDAELFKARRNYIFSTTRVVLKVLLC
jgi:hypothetical protein